MPTKIKENKNMSPAMFAFMSGLVEGKIKAGLKSFQILDQRTFGAVLARKYVLVSNSERLVITEKGYEAHRRYNDADVPYRKSIGELSDMVHKLLHLKSNRVKPKVRAINDQTSNRAIA